MWRPSGAGPFPALVAGAVLLCAMILVVNRSASPPHHSAPTDLQAWAHLARPPLAPEMLKAEAAAVLRELGYETQNLSASLSPRVNRLRAAAQALTPEEVESIANRGAPLVQWAISFFDPSEVLDAHTATVIFDQNGALCEVWSRLRPPPEGALDAAVARVAAAWSAGELVPGKARLEIGSDRSPESLNVYRAVSFPGADGRAMPRGLSFWAAFVLAGLVAFGMGAARRDSPPAPRLPVRPLVLAATALAAVLGLVEAAAMPKQAPYSLAITLGFLLGAALFGSLWLSIRRAERPRQLPAAGRVAFVVAVPLFYAAASFACLGWSFEGCCPACSLVRYALAPLVCLAVLLGLRDARFRAYALLLAALSLVPHCVCENMINAPWIARLGRSPMCYAPGFAGTVLAVAALEGLSARLSAAVAIVAGGVVAAGSVGHTVFHVPW